MISGLSTTSATVTSLELLVKEGLSVPLPGEVGFNRVGSSWESVLTRMQNEPEEGRLFLCVLSAWDLILGTGDLGQKQRKADAKNFKTAIPQNC